MKPRDCKQLFGIHRIDDVIIEWTIGADYDTTVYRAGRMEPNYPVPALFTRVGIYSVSVVLCELHKDGMILKQWTYRGYYYNEWYPHSQNT